MDRKKVENKDVGVKIGCILVAFSLWLYVYSVENPIVSRYITGVEVNIINSDILEDQEMILLANSSNLQVDIKISGNAYNVNSVTKDDFTLVLDLSEYAFKIGENNFPVEVANKPMGVTIENEGLLVVTCELAELSRDIANVRLEVTGKPGEDHEVAEAKQDILEASVKGTVEDIEKVDMVVGRIQLEGERYSFTRDVELIAVDENGQELPNVEVVPSVTNVEIVMHYTKEVDVEVNLINELPEGVEIKSIDTSLDKVTIYGEKDIIESIDVLQTEDIDLSNIDRDTKVTVPIKLPEGVQIKQDEASSVNVDINVDVYETKIYTYDIDVKNAPDDYEVDIENIKLTITVGGDTSIMSSLQKSDIEVYVDLDELDEGEHLVPIQILIPNGIELLEQNYDNISVRLTKDVEEEPEEETPEYEEPRNDSEEE